jgi:hypothetical protein
MHKTLVQQEHSTNNGANFSPRKMFNQKSDVEGSKHGRLASQASKSPTFLSSKWNVLMKMWRMISKGDDIHKIFSNNVQIMPINP